MLGPVFYYDLVRQSRRHFVPIARVLYLFGLYAVLLMGGLNWSHNSSGAPLPQGSIARFLEQFFSAFLTVQFLVVAALTPALTAGAISEEKESQTLPFLLASPLRRYEIVLGKLGSRLGTLLLIVLAGLPVFSLLQLLGGVDPGWLWAGFAATGMSMVSLAAISLFWSVVMKRSREAILWSYLTPPAYLLLSQLSKLISAASWAGFPDPEGVYSIGALATLFRAGDPFEAVGQSFRGLRGLSTVEDAVFAYAIFHAVVAVLALTLAVLRLRPSGLAEETTKAQATRLRQRLLYGGRPSVGANPVLWREVYAEHGLRANWLVLLVVLFFVGLSFWPLLEMLFRTPRSFDFRREIINVWVRIVGTLVACLLLLGVAVRASGSFTTERHKQTLDVLLTTPLSVDAILMGKWVGSLASVGWGWLWLGSIVGIGLLSGGLHLLSVPLLCVMWASYAAFLTVLATHYSLTATTTLRATVRTLMTAGFLWFGPWMTLGCCAALVPRAFGNEVVFKFLAGLTPPIALGVMSFSYETYDRRFTGEMIPYCLLGAGVWTTVAAVLTQATRERLRRQLGRRSAAE